MALKIVPGENVLGLFCLSIKLLHHLSEHVEFNIFQSCDLLEYITLGNDFHIAQCYLSFQKMSPSVSCCMREK